MKQTIIQQIQPQCDSLCTKIKNEKNRQHKSNQDIADHTGVPFTNVKNIFAGSVANPSVFYISAICIYLNISLDDLMGIKHDNNDKESADLERKLNDKNKDYEYMKELNKHLKNGIAERKPVIYCLVMLCIFLSVSLVGYIVMDLGNTNFGYFKSSRITIIGIAFIAVIVVSVAIFMAHIIIKQTKKRDDENG